MTTKSVINGGVTESVSDLTLASGAKYRITTRSVVNADKSIQTESRTQTVGPDDQVGPVTFSVAIQRGNLITYTMNHPGGAKESGQIVINSVTGEARKSSRITTPVMYPGANHQLMQKLTTTESVTRYSTLGRPTTSQSSTRTPDGQTITTFARFDAKGQLSRTETRILANNGKVSTAIGSNYHFDTHGRVVSYRETVSSQGATTIIEHSEMTYNARGQLASEQLRSVTTQGQIRTISRVTRLLQYDVQGRLIYRI
jgi:hypothetical protein